MGKKLMENYIQTKRCKWISESVPPTNIIKEHFLSDIENHNQHIETFVPYLNPARPPSLPPSLLLPPSPSLPYPFLPPPLPLPLFPMYWSRTTVKITHERKLIELEGTQAWIPNTCVELSYHRATAPVTLSSSKPAPPRFFFIFVCVCSS